VHDRPPLVNARYAVVGRERRGHQVAGGLHRRERSDQTGSREKAAPVNGHDNHPMGTADKLAICRLQATVARPTRAPNTRLAPDLRTCGTQRRGRHARPGHRVQDKAIGGRVVLVVVEVEETGYRRTVGHGQQRENTRGGSRPGPGRPFLQLT
jgi:hypothetical protein